MRDQETDRGNGLIIGGPSLFPVTELSTELFRFWNFISSWGFRFEELKCGAGSSLSTSSGSREGDRGDPDFRSLLYGGGFFRIKSVLGRPGKTDWIERRCLCLFFIDRIPIISVGGEGDKARVYVSQVSQEVKSGSRSVYPQPPSVISNLNSLFLFTSTLRATTRSPLTSKGKR
ncbi:UNVERIFIED_CONTAM: hypothetical protein Sradi_7079300 [Sesamum radiatum]|uniref:Uncharacterized protein n=1 Tax=Sesamum radiatum TaxID=300843 RepID=A0AAW2J4S1_SESRA